MAVVSRNGKIIRGKIELIIGYDVDSHRIARAISLIEGTFENLGHNFAIITIGVKDIAKISSIKGIKYAEIPRTLYSNEVDYSYGEERDSILGFISSGIDYTQKDFLDEQGESIIHFIYDLSQREKVWSKGDIDRALKINNAIEALPHKDTLGHGTYLSKKVLEKCGNENLIIVVKATPGRSIYHTKSSVIMKGIKYLTDKQRELGKNLIIYSSFHEKYNLHDDHSLFYQYIDTMSKKEGVKFIFEGKANLDRNVFKVGRISNFQSLPINIKNKRKGITLQLHKELLNNYTLEIVSPLGVSSGLIQLSQGYNNGSVGENKYHIYNTGPKSYNINGEIVINIVSNKDEIDKGQWKLNIICEDEYKGKFALDFGKYRSEE